MPAVALFLGIGLLGEQLTIGAVAGLCLIGLGAWLAASTLPPGTSTTRAPGPFQVLIGQADPGFLVVSPAVTIKQLADEAVITGHGKLLFASVGATTRSG